MKANIPIIKKSTERPIEKQSHKNKKKQVTQILQEIVYRKHSKTYSLRHREKSPNNLEKLSKHLLDPIINERWGFRR